MKKANVNVLRPPWIVNANVLHQDQTVNVTEMHHAREATSVTLVDHHHPGHVISTAGRAMATVSNHAGAEPRKDHGVEAVEIEKGTPVDPREEWKAGLGMDREMDLEVDRVILARGQEPGLTVRHGAREPTTRDRVGVILAGMIVVADPQG